MANFLVLVVMAVAALVPCVTAALWVKAGKYIWTLILFAVLAACLWISSQAATTDDMGVAPMRALGAALLVFLPATIGCAVGALLGWMVKRRREKKMQGNNDV